jgi:hypothetical protein
VLLVESLLLFPKEVVPSPLASSSPKYSPFEDEGTFLQNIRNDLPSDNASHPKRLESSATLL